MCTRVRACACNRRPVTDRDRAHTQCSRSKAPRSPRNADFAETREEAREDRIKARRSVAHFPISLSGFISRGTQSRAATTAPSSFSPIGDMCVGHACESGEILSLLSRAATVRGGF